MCSIQGISDGLPNGVPNGGVSKCIVSGSSVTITAAVNSAIGYAVVLDGVTNTAANKTIVGSLENF